MLKEMERLTMTSQLRDKIIKLIIFKIALKHSTNRSIFFRTIAVICITCVKVVVKKVLAKFANPTTKVKQDRSRSGADAIKKFTPSLGIPYLGV